MRTNARTTVNAINNFVLGLNIMVEISLYDDKTTVELYGERSQVKKAVEIFKTIPFLTLTSKRANEDNALLLYSFNEEA